MILLVGIGTLLAGIVMVLRHLHVWRLAVNSGPEGTQRRFLRLQLRRRILTSSCISVLGFIIALLHFLDYWRGNLSGSLILVSCALALVFMIFVLAMLDFVASTSALRPHKESARKAAEELAREYIRLRRKRDGQDAANTPEKPETDSAKDSL